MTDTSSTSGPLPLVARLGAMMTLLGGPTTDLATPATAPQGADTSSITQMQSNPSTSEQTPPPEPTGDLFAGSTTSVATPTPAGSSSPGKAGSLDDFMHALGQQESGGNYTAHNASGASGKYQIMPANWPSWAKDAGLPSNAPMTPENQETVARYKVQQYYKTFGNWNDVAKAWYSGPGNVKKNVGGGTGYPDSNGYASSVTSRMGK